jgi:Tfp pilus assembly protein PilX
MSFPGRSFPRPLVARARTAQRGVILIVVLLALVVLLIGVAALIRSVDTAGVMVGNLAFRRDLTNRAEEAIATAKATLAASAFDPTTDATGSYYSASKLANGNTGVPAILDNASSYKSTYSADITDASVSGDASISYRYVIDRQCNSGTGAFSTATCEYIAYNTSSNGTSGGGGSSQYSQRQVGGVFAGSGGAANCNGSNCAIYRISVRVAGPRNSVAYFQTTYVN